MTLFGNYSRYYDLLYRDKDYAAEADFVHELIQRHDPGARSILELGCGTGLHAELLARRGYSLQGVDLSEEMLLSAEARRSTLPDNIASELTFTRADIRSVRLGRKFDAVISLFHVMSYQTSNDDLMAAFASASEHLKAGGIFIFDCWYGPAVLTDRPEVRIKRLANEFIEITRIAEPQTYPNDNRVDVHYQVFIQDKQQGSIECLSETHRMRYLFLPELSSLAHQTGLSFVSASEWLTGREIGFSTWGVCCVLSKPTQ